MILTVVGLRHGQIVRSMVGRDAGVYYIIWNTLGEKFIEAVDGVKHPIARPKKKNLKHVQITMWIATEIEDAIIRGEQVKDAQIAAAIRRRINELEEGDRFHG